jgi:hypothetical protein
MADNDDQNQEVNYAEYSDSDIQGYIQQKEQEINSYLNQCVSQFEEKSQSFCISYL